MKYVNIKVGQVWAFPTSESWYRKFSLNENCELKYEGWRVVSIEPFSEVMDVTVIDVGLKNVKTGHVCRILTPRAEWPTEKQKLIEDVP